MGVILSSILFPRSFRKYQRIGSPSHPTLQETNIYKVVKEGAGVRDYEDALKWLCYANLTFKIYRSTALGLSISAYDDLLAFKLYMADVGLLRRLSLLAPSVIGEGNRLFVEFKGH